MSEKTTQAIVKENYLTQSTIDGFTYTMDYTDKTPELTPQGTSPTGLLLVALSGCHLMSAVSYLKLKRIDYTILRATITGDFTDQESEWVLNADIHLETDATLSDKQYQGLQAFIHRHCKVSSIVSKGDNQLRLYIHHVAA